MSNHGRVPSTVLDLEYVAGKMVPSDMSPVAKMLMEDLLLYQLDK
jgi:hypothetical protein